MSLDYGCMTSGGFCFRLLLYAYIGYWLSDHLIIDAIGNKDEGNMIL